MSECVVFYDPHCGKSRLILELLETHSIEPRIVNLRHSRLDRETLEDLLRRLRVRPRELLRRSAPLVRRLAHDLEDDESVVTAMVENPQLIDRPIVVWGDRAIVCRPPAKVLELIDEAHAP
jgi:arsenate reductase